MPCPQSIYKFKSFFAKLRSLHTSFRLLRLLCLSGWFPIGDLQRTITWDASIGCGTGISMRWPILGWACARPWSAGARRDRWHGRGMGSSSILRHLHSPGAKESCLKNEMACFFWMFFPYSAVFLRQIWRNCVFVYFSPFDYASFLFNISVFQIEHLWASNIKFLSGTLCQDLGRLARSWQCFQQISNHWRPTSRLNTTRIVNQLILSSITLSLQLLFALFNVEQSICSTWSRCISFTNSEVDLYENDTDLMHAQREFKDVLCKMVLLTDMLSLSSALSSWVN